MKKLCQRIDAISALEIASKFASKNEASKEEMSEANRLLSTNHFFSSAKAAQRVVEHATGAWSEPWLQINSLLKNLR